MDDDKPNRALQSVGKECFVKYFSEFFNDSHSNRDVVDVLMRTENYTEKACWTRVSNARRIIKAGRAMDALRDVNGSAWVPESVRDQATQIAADFQ